MMRLNALALMLAAISAAGCTTYKLEYEHISHPFAGPPFGPTHEEDSLDHIQACGSRTYAFNRSVRAYSEACAGYMFVNGGFYGPPITGSIRTGIEFGRE